MSDPLLRETRFLAPSLVAERLAITVDEVLALVHEGSLRAAQLGSPPRWRVDEASVCDYVEDRVNEARLMRLWRESQGASIAEMWQRSAPHLAAS